MNKQEYDYILELLELLENMIKNTVDLSINDGYYMSYIDDLREKLDKMFNEEGGTKA